MPSSILIPPLITFLIVLLVIYSAKRHPKSTLETAKVVEQSFSWIAWQHVALIISIFIGPVIVTKAFRAESLQVELFNNKLIIGSALEKIVDINKGLEEINDEVIQNVTSSTKISNLDFSTLPKLEVPISTPINKENIQQVQKKLDDTKLKLQSALRE